MKRLILCFDGTWNQLTKPAEVTNVVRVGQAVRAVDSKGVSQIVYYNSGVGSGGLVDQLVGGLFGAGVKSNVKRGLTFLSFNYDTGEPEVEGDPPGTPDEIYIFGFSRGAYTARALAGVLGAIGGIPKVSNFGEAEQLWSHYRKTKKRREKQQHKIDDMLYPVPANGKLIKCVAVWDTVGSYGIPTGLGLAGLGRFITSWTRNFRDNEIGRHIDYGFHAMAIDERRRAFTTTAWVPRTDTGEGASEVAEPEVEQLWFAGAHANVGGGYAQTGLSDQALLWIMARVQEKAGLQFQESYIQEHFFPCAACSAYRSYRGWWVSSLLPAIRAIPKRLTATAAAGQQPILDGRLHWSVKERLGKLSLVDQHRYRKYSPRNLASDAAEWDFTRREGMEDTLVKLCHLSQQNVRRPECALHCDLKKVDRNWLWGRRRARRMRKLREEWATTIAASNPEAP